MKALLITFVTLFSSLAISATLVQSQSFKSTLNSPENPKGLWYLAEVGTGFYNFSGSHIDDSGLQSQLGLGGAYFTKNWVHEGLFGLYRFENLDTNNWEYLVRLKADFTSSYRLDSKWQVGPSLSMILNTGEELLSNSSTSPFIGASVSRNFADEDLLYKVSFKSLVGTNIDATALLNFISLQVAYAPIKTAKVVKRKKLFEPIEIKEISKGEYKVYLKTVEFDLGKTHLTKRDRSELLKIGRSLKRSQDSFTSIIVKGHTDSIGSYKINKRISKQRAQRLKDYLVKSGVKSKVIKASGRADLEPKSAKMIARINRRAELIINSPLSKDELKEELMRNMY